MQLACRAEHCPKRAVNEAQCEEFSVLTVDWLAEFWVEEVEVFSRRHASCLRVTPRRDVAALVPVGQPADLQFVERPRLAQLCLDDASSTPGWQQAVVSVMKRESIEHGPDEKPAHTRHDPTPG